MVKFLIQKSINSLSDLGFEELYLFVSKGNINAIRLYEKIGFEIVNK